MATPKHNYTPSKNWSLQYLGNANLPVKTKFKLTNPFSWKNILGLSFSAQGALFELKNLTSGETATFVFSGLGISAGLGIASASFPSDPVTFETVHPYTFADFEGGARMGSINVGATGFNYSPLSFFVFNDIDINQPWIIGGDSINLSGPNIGSVAIASLSYYPLGDVTITNISSGAPQPTNNEINNIQSDGIPPWVDFPMSIDPFQSTAPHVSSSQNVPDWLIDAGNQLITNSLPNQNPTLIGNNDSGQLSWSPHDPGSNVALPTADDSGLTSATLQLTNYFSMDGNSFINPDGLATDPDSSSGNIGLTNLHGSEGLPIDQVLSHFVEGQCIDPSVLAHDNVSNADAQGILTHAINSHAQAPAVYEPQDNVCIDPGAVDHHN